MECFAHPSSPAVAACKACGRAVCRTCARDLGFAVACSDTCAKEAADLHEMNQRGKRIYGIGMKPKLASGVIVWIMFAVLFIGWGVFQTIKTGEPEWFPIIFGIGAGVIAAIVYRRSREIGLQC